MPPITSRRPLTVPDDEPEVLSPLAAFIRREADARKLSLAKVAQRGGMDEARLRYYAGHRRPADRPLKDTVVSGIAKGLGVPVYRVIEAMQESLGTDAAAGALSPAQQFVVNAMNRLDERHQRMVADVVLRIVEEYPSASGPDSNDVVS